MGVPAVAWVLTGGQWRRRGVGGVTPPPPPPPPATSRFPGDPGKNSRTLFWGQSKQSNGDVTYQETAAGVALGCHRTYYKGDTQLTIPGAMVNQIQADHAANRLPIVSFKVPNWATAATGARDTQWDAIIAELESYAKPTWLVLHHEPESSVGAVLDAAGQPTGNAGSAQDWCNMQAHFRARLTAYRAAHPTQPHRIALCSNLMGYTWDSASGRNPEDWYAGSAVNDLVAMDFYTTAAQTVERAAITGFMSWAVGKSLPWGVFEWGFHHDDLIAGQRITDFYNHMTDGAHDCCAISYFDSNTGGTDYTLTNTNGELTAFRTIMADKYAIHLSDLGY